MTVGRGFIAGRIAGETGLPRRLVITVINAFIDEIGEAVAGGDRVEIRNFGVFSRRELGERVLRNPRTGARMRAPARSALRFRPCKKFRSF